MGNGELALTQDPHIDTDYTTSSHDSRWSAQNGSGVKLFISHANLCNFSCLVRQNIHLNGWFHRKVHEKQGANLCNYSCEKYNCFGQFCTLGIALRPLFGRQRTMARLATSANVYESQKLVKINKLYA